MVESEDREVTKMAKAAKREDREAQLPARVNADGGHPSRSSCFVRFAHFRVFVIQTSPRLRESNLARSQQETP